MFYHDPKMQSFTMDGENVFDFYFEKYNCWDKQSLRWWVVGISFENIIQMRTFHFNFMVQKTLLDQLYYVSLKCLRNFKGVDKIMQCIAPIPNQLCWKTISAGQVYIVTNLFFLLLFIHKYCNLQTKQYLWEFEDLLHVRFTE